jgi:hypothetical protein
MGQVSSNVPPSRMISELEVGKDMMVMINM